MEVTLLTTCAKCAGALALKQAAIDKGHSVSVEIVQKSDKRTQRSADLGIGLPVLVRSDGKLSDDGRTWIGVNNSWKKPIEIPVEEVDDADDDQS